MAHLCLSHLSILLHSPSVLVFFFNDTATTEIYTLSLHDALPIYKMTFYATYEARPFAHGRRSLLPEGSLCCDDLRRSEEHTSELQSHLNLVCRLLLEKKNNNIKKQSMQSGRPR